MLAVLLPTITLDCKIRSRDLTTPIYRLFVMQRLIHVRCCDQYVPNTNISIFNSSEDIDRFQNFKVGYVTQATPI